MSIFFSELDGESSNEIDSTLETQIEQQSDEYFTIYDQLKSWNYDDYVAILNENKQIVPDTKNEVNYIFINRYN